MQKAILHLMDFLANHLCSEDQAYLRQVCAPSPRRGLSAGAAAADRAHDVASHLLKHHLSRYPVPEWVHQQVYLHPYPKELMLRNHVQVDLVGRQKASKRLADALSAPHHYALAAGKVAVIQERDTDKTSIASVESVRGMLTEEPGI